MNRVTMWVLAVAPLAPACLGPTLAHAAEGYGPPGVPGQKVQSTVAPSGTAMQPGSQLLFLLDAGLRSAVGASRTGPSAGPPVPNPISVTNTHPTDAVTVLLRYHNQALVPVLSFLAVLPCRATLAGDAFRLPIPGTSLTVGDRLFGLPSASFGDGRFLLAVTAVGAVGNDSGTNGDTSPLGDRGDFDDPEDLDAFADWRVPQELAPADLVARCPGVDPDRIGVEPGASDHNLSVLNASAMSFNYLVGHHVVDVTSSDGERHLGGHVVPAWSRPAVNVSIDLDAEDTSEQPDQNPDYTPQDINEDGIFDINDRTALTDDDRDGNGPLAPKGVILAGTEEIWLRLVRNAVLVLPANFFALRTDAYGGQIVETNCEGPTSDSLRCNASNPWRPAPLTGGAMGWTPLPLPGRQLVALISAKDDYNGSNESGTPSAALPQTPVIPAGARDNGYRLDRAATYWHAKAFDPEGDILATTNVAAVGLDAYLYETQAIPGDSLVPGGTVSDFVLTPRLGQLDRADVNGGVSAQWVRFDRLRTRDFFYVGGDPDFAFAVPYDGERGSYLAIAQSLLLSGQPTRTFATYLPLVATDGP